MPIMSLVPDVSSLSLPKTEFCKHVWTHIPTRRTINYCKISPGLQQADCDDCGKMKMGSQINLLILVGHANTINL